jgi:hypothetical protein
LCESVYFVKIDQFIVHSRDNNVENRDANSRTCAGECGDGRERAGSGKMRKLIVQFYKVAIWTNLNFYAFEDAIFLAERLLAEGNVDKTTAIA